MAVDALGRAVPFGDLAASPGNDPRSAAIAAFMFLMQFRRDLVDGKALLLAASGAAAAARIDPDISMCNAALLSAALALEASRPA